MCHVHLWFLVILLKVLGTEKVSNSMLIKYAIIVNDEIEFVNDRILGSLFVWEPVPPVNVYFK